MDIKRSWIMGAIVTCVVLAFALAPAAFAAADSVEIASYSIGYNTGVEVSKSSTVIAGEPFVAGFKDGYAKKQPMYSQEDMAKASEDLNKLAIEKAGAQENVTPEIIGSLEVPEDVKKIISYGSGFMFAMQLEQAGGLFEEDSIVKGLNEGIAGKASPYTPEQAEKALKELEKEFTARMTASISEMAKPNIEAGKKFIEEYKKQDGVIETPEGMVYKVINVGTGKSPSPTDTVSMHYTGKLIDGTVFDSSIARGEPLEFDLQGVIPGWTLIAPKMKVGDKWEVVIPYNLAYDMQGVPSVGIKPGDTLVFEMELMDVK